MSWTRLIDGLQAILILIMTGANRSTIIVTLINLLMSELKLLKMPLLTASKRKYAYVETLSIDDGTKGSNTRKNMVYIPMNEIIANLIGRGFVFDVVYGQE